MFTRKFWHVLIVDDEPDIHEVTELNLKKEEFFGVKLKLHHAHSAQEAMTMLRADPSLMRSLAVAIVDVVMETDHAGLDFCRFVREEMKRQSCQLVLRTGQPGQAPPRKIIDELSLTNYLTKLEASSDRLYMTLKAAIQQYYETSVVENWAMALEAIRTANTTKQGVLESFQRWLAQDWGQHQQFNVAYDFFGEHYAGGGYFLDKANYDAIKDDVFKRAESQLTAPSGIAYYGVDRAAVSISNRVAKVDDYVICQTSAIGTNKLASMIVKGASYPRESLIYNSVIWRIPLTWLAQALV